MKEWRVTINTGATTLMAAHFEVTERGDLIFYDESHTPIQAMAPGDWGHVEPWSQ